MDTRSHSRINRRRFLATSAVLSLPLVFGASAAPDERKRSPSDKINVGIVGCGHQGMGDTRAFLDLKDCRVVAVCDVDKKHLTTGVNTVNNFYQDKHCKAYHDFRELMARPDIDAIMMAVPDHWHELVAVEAARHKKDIYGEKPLARTIAEQQAVVKAVQANKCIWQTGSWQRSVANFHKAAEIVRNGLIGEVTHVEVGLPYALPASVMNPAIMIQSDPPPELNYDLWTGPSQMTPYIAGRVHQKWRYNYNTGGGVLMDWVGHHCDIAHWGLDFDRSGPSEIEGHGEFPPKDAIWNACTRYRIELKYPRNITMTIAGGHDDIKVGTKWIGKDGWVYVDRGKFEASREEWEDIKQLPDDQRKVKLPVSSNHQQNFLDSVRSRQPTITPVETAHHSTIPGHLGLISMLVGRKLRWDNSTETILGDEEASKLLTRPFREPWKIES